MKALIVGVGVCCVLLAGCSSSDSSSGSAQDGSTTMNQLQSPEADVVGPGEEESADCTYTTATLTPLLNENLTRISSFLQEINLAGCDLTGLDLPNQVLTGLDLSNTNLTDAGLDNADLSGANLSGANLSGASLSLARLKNTNMSGANLTGANLAGVMWSNTTCPNGQVQSTPCI